MGSTRALTDDGGDASDTHVYDAWGNEVDVSGTTVNPFRWLGRVGYYWDEGTGTFYIRARVYEPVIGRWMSQDPLFYSLAEPVRWFARREIGARTTRSELQLYRYVRNGPVAVDDPSGMHSMKTSSLTGATAPSTAAATAVQGNGGIIEGIGGSFLSGLVPLFPIACGAVCGGQFYGAALPGGTPAGIFGFREGMFFGVLWVDNGTCEQTRARGGEPKVHVKLLYTTLTISEESIDCNFTAEQEFLKGIIVPRAEFHSLPHGCSFLNTGHVEQRTGIPPDCSFATFEWECPIDCLPGWRWEDPSTLVPTK